VLSPERIVVGGGVMRRRGLLGRVRAEVRRILAGYVRESDIVEPGLGERAGVLGAMALAQEEMADDADR